ncbi:MAG: flagellar filament capping protein FliD [Ruminiclostridium sp.]|nr:flagellar filament capping protein FliD [Ruminiclostridium sp.]
MSSNDLIRMSGMNSGLDTESIINALTANTKLKATKQERNVLKYEATQEAYRDIISKMQNIKNKYFDILNKDSYIAGTSMWNKYKSTITDSAGAELLSSGISVETTVNSTPKDYKVTVKNTAKQAKIVGKSIGSNASVDTSSIENGKTYSMKITVGDNEKIVSFTGGADAAATRNNLNDALEEAFGESNSSAGSNGNKGMVYVDDNGQLISRAGKGITMSGVENVNATNTIDLTNVVKGTNTLSFTVGNETLNVSFQTASQDYFSKAISAGFIDETTGEILPQFNVANDTSDYSNLADYHNPEWDSKMDALIQEKLGDAYETATDEERFAARAEVETEIYDQIALYQSVRDDYKESVRYDAFNAYKAAATTDDTAWEDSDEFNALYSKAVEQQEKQLVSSWLDGDEAISAKYNEYKSGQIAYNTKYEDIYTWANSIEDEDVRAKLDEFVNKFNGTTETDEELQAAYTEYTEGLGEDETPQDFDTWKAEHIEKNSYHLSKDTFAASEQKQFAAFKESSAFSESDMSYDLSAENIIDHFNESTLKNTIGNLTTRSGVTFSVSYDKDTDVASITASDADGNPVSASMSVASGSANNAAALNASANDATTLISQITNTTKLSDIGATADENGNYSFSVNGKDFSFSGDTTVNDMMKKINASSAGVKMTYSSLNNAFTVTSNTYGKESAVDIADTNGGNLMSLLGITGGTKTDGENLEVEIDGVLYESDSASIEADGSTFTFSGNTAVNEEFTVSIGKDTSAIKDLIKDFVNDSNQLITDVYKYLDEKPESSYYFLTDADKEELDLTDKQEEKWEEKSKLGLLYNDRTTSSVMTGLRTALMGSIEGLDGNIFSLSSMGIKTVSDYSQHGKIAAIDTDKLSSAIENHLDDIQKLFSDTDNGIMKKFAAALDAGIKSTGDDKGSLVRKAGLATGTTSKDNEIYNDIKRAKSRITTLNLRYENEQNRLWKKYSSMESLLGTFNSQQASFNSYFMQ